MDVAGDGRGADDQPVPGDGDGQPGGGRQAVLAEAGADGPRPGGQGDGRRGRPARPQRRSAVTASRPTPPRSGFTLLELLLALGLGVILLGGLYVALQTTVQQTQVSRDAADIEGLSRAVFGKVGTDLSNVLGPPPPKSGGGVPDTAAAPTTTPSATTPAPMATTPAAPAADAAADPEAEPAAEPADAEATQGAATLPLQLGVFGDATRLSVFASRVPGAFAPGGRTAEGQQQPADLVRIDYWLGSGGGLCRKESLWVTAQGVWDSATPDMSTEAADVIAEEVTGVTFEYHDGTDWTESWSGGSGSVPAPPRAVRVTLSFSFANPRGGDRIERTVSQVLAVRTAPGSAVPTLTDPVASSGEMPAEQGGGTGSGTSGSGTGSGGASSGSSGGKTGASSGGGASGAKSPSSGGSSGGSTGTGGRSTGGTTGGGGTGGGATGGGMGGGSGTTGGGGTGGAKGGGR
ncbi:MAG: hypothetical protein C0501_13770 [Isosphaera sp.]|nr:hypothetical protein [Isosphaera sp.]